MRDRSSPSAGNSVASSGGEQSVDRERLRAVPPKAPRDDLDITVKLSSTTDDDAPQIDWSPDE